MWLSACIRMSGTGLSVLGLIHSVRPLVEADVFVCAICVLRSVPRVDVKGLSKTSLGTATACCQADWSLWRDVQSRRRGLYIWGELQYMGNKAIHVSSRGSGFECTVIREHEWVSSVRLFRACDANTRIKAFLNISELKLKIHAKFTLISNRYKESRRVHHRSLKLRSSVDNQCKLPFASRHYSDTNPCTVLCTYSYLLPRSVSSELHNTKWLCGTVLFTIKTEQIL